jgi:selenocysteine lyase/cysteine desulfurase
MTLIDPVVPARTAEAPLLPVCGADLGVPVLGGRHRRYVNLDCAATAPALVAVAERVTRLLPWYAGVHGGAGVPSLGCTALHEQARAAIADACGARAGDAAVLTRNTTDALRLLAHAVPAGGEVVSFDLEHHANDLPWRTRDHRLLPTAPTIAGTLARLAAALDERPAALVAITGASNVTGELLPVADVVAIAHARGARVVVDAAQLAPHGRVDLAGWGADYVALSGHKAYAPYGTGALVGRRDWLDAAAPYLPGGGAVRDVRENGVDWADGPRRHEGGTPNLVGAVALAVALRELAELPDGALEAHEAALRDRLLDGFATLPRVHPVRAFADSTDAIGVVAFTVDGFAPAEVSAYLSAEHAIGVRDGRFCAHQLLTRLGLPGGAVRASFGVGTTTADVDRLLEALAQLVTEGPRARYTRTATGVAPVDDDRRLPAALTL